MSSHSAFSLIKLIASHGECTPAVYVDYGFSNTHNPDDLTMMQNVYRDILTSKSFDVEKLHSMCIRNKLPNYIKSIYKREWIHPDVVRPAKLNENLTWFRRNKHLFRNIY